MKTVIMNAVSSIVILSGLIYDIAGFEFTILHTNDIHTRFEETDSYGGECTNELAALNQCFGGVARRATVIKQLTESNPNVILIDAGDEFQGSTLWYYVYHGLATAHFMNILQYDIMALGNHEFDNGVSEVIDFLNNVSFPVISCNINSSNEPDMTSLFSCSHVVDIDGQQLAFVGYTTVTTSDFSKPGELVFEDEIPVLRKEVARLQDAGIDKIIALGHSGIDKDLEIARLVPGIDVVVGGHSNTFLYTGDAPSTQSPYGEYPLVVRPDDDPSRTVLVVQSYAYGIYLGHLHVTFDETGEVDSFDGNPIFLDSTVGKDPEVYAEMQLWKQEVQIVSSSIVGQTVVYLDGTFSSCGIGECNLGNVLVDAMVFDSLHYQSDVEGWTTVSLAIHTAGSIKASLPQGDIRIGQLNQVLPYGNTIDIVTLKGRHLIEVLETAVAGVTEIEPSNSFPQVSGMRIEFDILRAPMERVLSVLVLCSACNVPVYEPMMDDVTYKVAMNSYMAGGGGGFSVVKDHRLNKESGKLDLDVTIAYITANSPIRTGNENRITVYDSQHRPTSKGYRISRSQPLLITIVVFLVAAR